MVAVLPEDRSSVEAFVARHTLRYPVIADGSGELAAAWQASGRSTAVVSSDLRVVRTYEAPEAAGHAERVLSDLALAFDFDCELCLAHKMTPWLHEDHESWVAECMLCSTPMVVWRGHGLPDATTQQRLMATLSRVADRELGAGGWWPDENRRNIPDHWHAHARPSGGFFGRRRT